MKQATILWSDTKSELSQKYNILFNNYVPYCGECKKDDETINNDLEAFRILCKIYYNYYNNGIDNYQREQKDYNKKKIKSPADNFMKSCNIYNAYYLETSIKNTIKWCWDRNATRQDKYEFLTWKRNRVL